MAKKLVKNYVFTPGVSLDENLFPEGWSLVNQNRQFIIKEIVAFIQNQIDGAAKCERDIGYLVDAVGFDLTLGTNYNSVFQGLAEYNSVDISETVVRTINRARNYILTIGSVASNATAVSRVNTFFNEVIDIGVNGRNSADAVTFTTPTSGSTSSEVAAKDRLVANKNFLAAEINAWVAVNYPSADHDVAKCTRDVKYAIDALCYDILYGGNSATYDQAKFFFYGFADGSPGIDPTHKVATVAAYGRLKTIVGEVVRGDTVTVSTGNALSQNLSGSNADSSDATILENLVQITYDVVDSANQAAALVVLAGYGRTAPDVTWAAAGLQSAKSAIDSAKTTIVSTAVGYTGYVYDATKCERDTGYVIDALLHDLRYGGNEEIYRVASRYWDGDVPQIDGTRFPEYDAYEFAQDLIMIYILENLLDDNPEQDIEIQVIDNNLNTESGPADRVEELLGYIISVIQNGLSSLPTRELAVGRVEVLGKIELEDLLLISNVTDNVVIYNFAEPTKGATVTFTEGNSAAYPNALQVNNGVTVIKFKYDTSLMSSTDSIQVFLENTELKVRPYDFGTDAIERMRVAQPQAMLDADFEYGLQPTKWQAIGTQRGYPSTYELSATDITVDNITTDASSGTSGVGASLITVTTQSAHGLSAGSPITIRALASSITGFARAEGTFLVYDVTATNIFRYYAKAKVGTSNGQVLATSSSQLRQAAFYTGASVGSATISVASNGSSGTLTTAALRTEAGGNTLSFLGTPPPVGSPLSGTGIASGTQVTGVFGDANSDGIQDYKFVQTTYSPGATSIDLIDVTGLEAGMAVGNEASPNLLREVTSIVGTTLNLNGSVTVGKTGDESSYTGSLSTVTPSGSNCFLDIDVTSGVYSVVGIGGSGGGSDWQQGDTLLITGDNLGGTSPTNDLYLNVDTVSGGAVTAVTIIEGTGTGTASFTDIEAFSTGARGTGGGNFTIDRAGGFYTCTIFPTTGSSKYYVGNRYLVAGTNFEGTSPANDVFITVTSVSGTELAEIAVSGTAARGDQIPVYTTITISENTTANVNASSSITYSAIATIQVDFVSNHGLVPGNSLNVAISSAGTNHPLAAGPFSVESVPSLTTIQYTARGPGTVDTSTPLLGSVYVRPDTFFTHRPFDGGVQLGTGGPQHGGQAIRQSKKYIRYQSGKGAMYNTGALFAPSYDIRSVTAASTAQGSVITVITDDVDHGVQAGAVVRLSGLQTTGYNGDYTVTEIVDERTFRVTAQTQLGSTTATVGSQCQMSLLNWHGAVVRSGPFDDQNGIFFQYDGQKLSVGRRTSTFQIAGTISVDTNSNSITGTNTRFRDQLQEGDRVVIRGMTHVVSKIDSNTSMYVTPDFRGVNNVSGVKVCKVQDLIIPQDQWNLDRCDGTGPSGYNIDITKMQMIGIQFSWYGAGFIDWMLRGPDGNYVFCHRLKGNNLNSEAYMRTGNGPVRYEVLNEGARSRLAASISDEQTFLQLDDVTDFPTSGIVYVDNELISFSGKSVSQNYLTGCTRSASLTNFAAGAVRTYTAGDAVAHSADAGVVLVSCTTSPIISHWGSAYLIDGNFDSDRGYIFNYAATGISATLDKKTAFFIRLAPSVSNAVVGDLGERELLNRAQLLLQQLSITSDTVTGGGAIVVEGILNPSNYPTDPSRITWNGLQAAAAGGQPSFAQIALGGSVDWGGSSSTSTATVQGALTTTANASSFNTITQTLTARYWTSTTTVPNSPYSSRGAVANSYAIDNNSGDSRREVFITTADYDAAATTISVGDALSGASSGAFRNNTNISQIQRNYITVGGTNYTRLVIDEDIQTTSGFQVDVTFTCRSAIADEYNRAIRTGRSGILISNSLVTSSGLRVNDTVSNATYMTSARTINSITSSYFKTGGVLYSLLSLSGGGSSDSPSGAGTQSMTITAFQTASSYSGSNYIFFTSASWEASGAGVSTRVATTDTKFPAGTTVTGITTRSLSTTTIYRVTFSQTLSSSAAAAGTITFQFGAAYALPGEQVFSFISNPGDTDVLELKELKELGTTAIGGRGTFPNGPDTLAINIYKVSGTATPVNIILRWGEAQA
jgi:hypothetical protein